MEITPTKLRQACSREYWVVSVTPLRLASQTSSAMLTRPR